MNILLFEKKIDQLKGVFPIVEEEEKYVTTRFGTLFAKNNINALTDSSFESFLYEKNNKHWSQLYRSKQKLLHNFEDKKKNIQYLLHGRDPLHIRIDSINEKGNSRNIDGMGKAIFSAMLLVTYPIYNGVWNSRSEAALKKMQFFPQIKGDSIGIAYIKINTVLQFLSKHFNISLWKVDRILGEIAGDTKN